MAQKSWKKLINEISLGPRQQELVKLFIESDPSYGEELADIYQGVIRVITDTGIPDRIALAANGARELMAVYKKRFLGITGDSINKDNVKKILRKRDPLGGPPEEISENIAQEFVKLYRWFAGIAHHEKKCKANEFSENLNILEELFFVLLKPHFIVLNEIEKLIKGPKTRSNIKKIIVRLRNKTLSNYIFEKAGSDLLEPLVKEGFFKNPARPIQNEDGSISFPIWPESRFLVRIADKKPKKVLEVIKNCNIPSKAKELNPYVLKDFVDAALKMPSKFAKEIVFLVEKQKWLQCPYYSLLPEKLGDLMEKLAKDNEIKLTLKLALLLFDVKIDEPIRLKGKKGPFSFIHQDAKPLYEEWQLEQIIKNKTKNLKEKTPDKFISILCSKLNYALLLEEEQRNIDKKESERERDNDFSYIWRPHIASAKDYSKDVKDIFITTILEILREAGEKQPAILPKMLNFLKKYPYPVFKRIELYTYNLFPQYFKKEIKQALTDKTILYAYNLRQEYLPLLKDHFGKLDKKEQKKILGLIEKAPQFKKGEEVEELKDNWRLKYLHPIKDDLPKNWKMKYDKLLLKFGEPQYNDMIMKTWTGPTSPITLEELREKKVNEIVKYLMRWQPPKDFFGASSPEGLGRLLSEVIKEQPEEFSNSATLFYNKKIRPVYIYHLFWGLQQALKDKRCFNWNPVIDLALKIVRSKKLEMFEKSSDKLEQDWDSVMKSIVDLYGDGFGSSCSIPFKRRADVWQAIKKISEHEEPDSEYEKKYGGDNMDPATLSINTVRGEAMHTVIEYALWCARNLYSREKGKFVEVKLVPEAKKVLQKHLDPKIDPSATIHAVYGWYLPKLFYLDKKWLKDNLDKIFPKEPKLLNLWVAAFETYLRNNIYRDIFSLLKKDYLRSIHYMQSGYSQKRRAFDRREKLPQHSMLAYAYGFDKNDELTTKFFELTPVGVRSKAIWFIGANILKKELKNVPKESHDIKLEKIQQLWHQRLLIDEPIKNKEELKGFGWWFVNSPFDKKWTIGSLLKTLQITNGEIESTHQVIDELSNYAKDFPLLTIKCLDSIAKGDKMGWEIYFKKEEYKKIIQMVRQNKKKEAKKEADRLINYLGERGYLEFKELL